MGALVKNLYLEHTNFTSILVECQSPEEFVKRLKGLLHHVQARHEWKGGKCEFLPLRVCSCGKGEDRDDIKCDRKPYSTRIKLCWLTKLTVL